MDLHPENDASSWLVSYNNYLHDVVGTTATTRIRYSRVVRHFIGACLDGYAGWTKLSVQRVTEFVQEETASKVGCGRSVPIVAVRSFLRFLAWRGIVPAGLDRAIPRTRLARHASLPRQLSVDQVTQLLDAARMGKAARRDCAILLLLTRLALRSSEIIALEIDDIDWRAELIRICISKSHRERSLAVAARRGHGTCGLCPARPAIWTESGGVLQRQRPGPPPSLAHRNHDHGPTLSRSCRHPTRSAQRGPYASPYRGQPIGEQRCDFP